jgi:uncharacterized membrane protein
VFIIVGISLIFVGTGILILMLINEWESENKENVSVLKKIFYFIFPIIDILSGTSILILPLGLIFLGIVILIYH